MLGLRRRAIMRKASELRRFVRGGLGVPSGIPRCQRDRDLFLPLPAAILMAQHRLLGQWSAHLTKLSASVASFNDLILKGPKA